MRIVRRAHAPRAPASGPAPARVRCEHRGTNRRTPSSACGSNLPGHHSLASGDSAVYISAAMDRDRLLGELNEFLRIPSVSTLPAHNTDFCRAADWAGSELQRL